MYLATVPLRVCCVTSVKVQVYVALVPVETDCVPLKTTCVPTGTVCTLPALAVGGPGSTRETSVFEK